MSMKSLLDGILASGGIESKGFEDGEVVPVEFLKHEHLRGIRIFSVERPLPCGSQYFVRLNSYCLGFADMEELAHFRNNINSSFSEILRRALQPDPELVPCLICGKEVGVDEGFKTTIGWMHWQCNQENATNG